jgi:heterotetrameric sarcosine oxidase gamma subunit
MADTGLKALSPFAGLLHSVGSGGGVTVSDRDGLGLASLLTLKGQRVTVAERLATAYGIALPDGPNRVAVDDVAVIGTGPGKWLAVREGAANGLAVDLAALLEGAAAVADQSDGYAVLRLQGPALRQVLAKGVAIDLHDLAFLVNQAAVTAIAHIGVIVWRLDDGPDGSPVFEIALFRSMAGSFMHWLESSAGEFGLKVVNSTE